MIFFNLLIIPDEPAVGPDSPHPKAGCHPVNCPDVLGPDTGTQAVPEQANYQYCRQRQTDCSTLSQRLGLLCHNKDTARGYGTYNTDSFESIEG